MLFFIKLVCSLCSFCAGKVVTNAILNIWTMCVFIIRTYRIKQRLPLAAAAL